MTSSASPRGRHLAVIAGCLAALGYGGLMLAWALGSHVGFDGPPPWETGSGAWAGMSGLERSLALEGTTLLAALAAATLLALVRPRGRAVPRRLLTRAGRPADGRGGVGAAGRRHRVVVIGGGFGGLQAVRGLRRAPVDVTLVDRRNFHLFQPLLYQVATGALSAGEIATPLRGILKRQRNARVVLGVVTRFDLDQQRVLLGQSANDGEQMALDYDTLVVAAGAGHAYFGHDEWRPLAPSLKTLEDATEVRGRILAAFEAAELEQDAERRRAWLTFVVVGAGPTGVELAGQIAEIAHDTLRRDFRSIDPADASILLLEADDRVLTGFPERLSARAARALQRLGVTPAVGRMVVDLDEQSVSVRTPDGGLERIPTRTAIWAAGVRASGLAGMLGEASGARVDSAGRVEVGPKLTLPGHPEVFALGDMVRVQDEQGRPEQLPGVAPLAMQQGRYAAKVIRARLEGRERGAFRYLDKGNVATIGRLKAVIDLRGVPLSGTLAWLGYLFIHLFYLVGLQNRLLVFIRWIGSFLTRGRGSRLITGHGSRLARPAPRPTGGRLATSWPCPPPPAPTAHGLTPSRASSDSTPLP